MEAYRDLDRIQGMDEVGRRRWLRTMLVHNLLDKIRRPTREVNLDHLVDAATVSSMRLGEWLAAEDTPPSVKASEKERALRLLEALSKLPDRQREALILQKYHGWTLAQIAEHMGCTDGVIAGLHARGLKKLRELLPDMESEP
jgi:RNA polymerase sigma-70 factor, ECF subfamily